MKKNVYKSINDQRMCRYFIILELKKQEGGEIGLVEPVTKTGPCQQN